MQISRPTQLVKILMKTLRSRDRLQNFVRDHLHTETSHKEILVEHQAEQHGNDKCGYFENTIHDQRRVSAECGTVQPTSDYGELASVLTLITISVVAFAVPAGLWLLHRLFRYWLRSLISRYKTASNLSIHTGLQ